MTALVAVLALTLGPPVPPPGPDYFALAADLGHPRYAVRQHAHEALAGGRGHAVPALVWAAGSRDAERRERALSLLWLRADVPIAPDLIRVTHP